ncbi:MAG: MlaD family protein [Prevotella sp.]|nr:MlaD family protein [Prevotella sp.]MCM1074054.1 MlaD family protein [Ruminococcus sp.]
MKKIFSKELIIGLCVIIALVILYFGINYLKGINLFKPANFYVVEYENVMGLETAASVTIDGYKVGQVRDIEFDYDKPGKIKVTLALNENLHVPEDSRALIESSLLGGPSIVLKLGQSKNMIPVGGTIKSGVNAGLMSTVSDEIMPKVTEILPTLDSLMTNLNSTAQNINTLSGHPALLTSVDRLDEITANVAGLSNELRRDLNGVFATNVPALMRNATSVTMNLDSMSRNLAKLSYNLKNIPVDATMEDLNVIMGNLKGLSANLETLSSNLNNPNGTVGKMLNDPTIYNRLSQVTADIDSLIVDIKRNPKRYISIKLL